MNIYEVYPASENGPQWESLPKAEISNVQWIDAPGIQAWAQLCYDQEYLYVRLEAVEEHILARYTGDNDPVCNDSCLEFFFASREEGIRYFNMEVNPNGACYFGYGKLRNERCRLLGKKLGDIVVLAPPMLKMLPTMFAWPQLFTALIGGAVALLITPVLRKALHR